jgi:hypothetical protein
VTIPEESRPQQGTKWLPFWWCLPALLGFVAFLFAFPIDRRISNWFPFNFAEIFYVWFLFVTPVTTMLAIVGLVKRKRTGPMAPVATFLTWAAIGASLVVNALVLVGMWASTY